VTIIFSTAYFAPVSYYACLLSCDSALMGKFRSTPNTACIEQFEHYHKQTYRNRCTISAANGPLSLSVPVILKNDQPIRDVRIDYRTSWQHQHWNSIESAYSTTPFFEYYQDDLLPVFNQRHEFLFDKDEALRETICSLLGIHPTLTFSDDYLSETAAATADGIIDLRNTIHPKKTVSISNYTSLPYPQVFDDRFGFQPELSILDLLFNKGPEALLILKDSIPS